MERRIPASSHPAKLAPKHGVKNDNRLRADAEQDQSIEQEHMHLPAKDVFGRAEKDAAVAARPIVDLFHLRLGNEVGNFLIHVERLGRDALARLEIWIGRED